MKLSGKSQLLPTLVTGAGFLHFYSMAIVAGSGDNVDGFLLAHTILTTACFTCLGWSIRRLPASLSVLLSLSAMVLWAVYPQKYLLYVLSPDILVGIIPVLSDAVSDSANLRTAYCQASYGLVGLSVASLVLVWLESVRPTRHRASNVSQFFSTDGLQTVNLLRVSVVVVWIITSIAVLQYDVGVTGVSVGTLPYRLAGVIVYSRTILCPVMLLTAEFVRLGYQRVISHTFVAMFLIMGVTDAVLRASKGSFLTITLALVVFFAAHEIRGRRILLHQQYLGFGIILLLAASAAPLIGGYRELIRVTGSPSVAELQEAFRQRITESAGSSSSAGGIASEVALRLTGIEQLAVSIQHIDIPLVYDMTGVYEEGGVTAYFTYAIYQYPGYARMGIAPSYFGWWNAVFGAWGPFVGGIGFGGVLLLLQFFGESSMQEVQPVWESISGVLVTSLLLEGTVEAWPLSVVIAMVCCLGVRQLVRRRLRLLGTAASRDSIRRTMKDEYHNATTQSAASL